MITIITTIEIISCQLSKIRRISIMENYKHKYKYKDKEINKSNRVNIEWEIR
jgi:hypothetical protein